jgi:hypothetical protein
MIQCRLIREAFTQLYLLAFVRENRPVFVFDCRA